MADKLIRRYGRGHLHFITSSNPGIPLSQRPDGFFAILVTRFPTPPLTSVRLTQTSLTAFARHRGISMNETSYAIRRTTPRFAFIAEAEIVGAKDRSRVSELSARGCYVDTINPLPKGEALQLRIRYGCSTCAFPVKVIYTHRS